jgi:sulfate adenylyltransferase
MTDLDTVLASLVPWHPPRQVLELAELVVTGAVDQLPVDLPVPIDLAVQARSGAGLAVEDAEGTPVAALQAAARAGRWSVQPLRPFSHGPLRSARRPPAEVRTELTAAGPGPVLAVVVGRALSQAEVKGVQDRIAAGVRPLWIALVGQGRREDLPAEALWRAVRELSGTAPAVPVAVPVLAGGQADTELVDAVAQAHGAGQVLRFGPREAKAPVHPLFARELARAVPPPDRRGLTVFFTGLSGSGKSTVAKALAEALEQDGRRRVSLLDGDEIRRLLSAGLGFSRADRDLNIRRIGFVATEVTRHGGLAICAPIAPFAQVRSEVRSWISEVGDFLLVHISTPLEECERRDRKGLYAKARQGLIAEFTGISSPYEVPTDADLVIDTAGVSVPDAVARVWSVIADRGYLGPT